VVAVAAVAAVAAAQAQEAMRQDAALQEGVELVFDELRLTGGFRATNSRARMSAQGRYGELSIATPMHMS
jgi:hypothetical protein